MQLHASCDPHKRPIASTLSTNATTSKQSLVRGRGAKQARVAQGKGKHGPSRAANSSLSAAASCSFNGGGNAGPSARPTTLSLFVLAVGAGVN